MGFAKCIIVSFAKNVTMCSNNAAKKIFRPWDAMTTVTEEINNKVQEAVISTTTSSPEEEVAETARTETTETENFKAERETSKVATVKEPVNPDRKVLRMCRKKLSSEKKSSSSSSAAFKTEKPSVHVSAFKTTQSSSGASGIAPAITSSDPQHQFPRQGCRQLSCGATDAYPVYPAEYLAHSLGLAATDQLFLESMAHGYAMEEYARILNEEHQAKLMSSRKQRPKKYRCPHCDVGFSNNGQLKGHIRIHTGERPFKCDEKNCGKTFTRNEELTRHKRIHSGLRPFPCTHCGKRFGRKDHLKKHSRTHLQPRTLYAALPVMLPTSVLDTCYPATGSTYPPGFIPMYGY